VLCRVTRRRISASGLYARPWLTAGFGNSHRLPDRHAHCRQCPLCGSSRRVPRLFARHAAAFQCRRRRCTSRITGLLGENAGVGSACNRLTAGGRWIRTLRTAARKRRVSEGAPGIAGGSRMPESQSASCCGDAPRTLVFPPTYLRHAAPNSGHAGGATRAGIVIGADALFTRHVYDHARCRATPTGPASEYFWTSHGHW
jgi:hypothetical protein